MAQCFQAILVSSQRPRTTAARKIGQAYDVHCFNWYHSFVSVVIRRPLPDTVQMRAATTVKALQYQLNLRSTP